MVKVVADSIIALGGRSAGMTVKTVSASSNSLYSKENQQTKNSSPSVNISLSSAAKQISEILSKPTTSTASPSEFDSFLNSTHRQILEDGKNAYVFNETPADKSSARMTLAKQAANYLSTSMYGDDKLFENVSSENPFASVDRSSLSKMAFDSSGSFTSAERQLAYLEMTTRDTEFENKTFDLQSSLSSVNPSIPWGDITSNLRDSQIASTMSDGEKAWRGWPSSEELQNKAERLIKQFNADYPALPDYLKLKSSSNSALIAISEGDGSVSWKSVSLNKAAAGDVAISLIQSAENESKKRQDQTSEYKTSIYQEIDDYNA